MKKLITLCVLFLFWAQIAIAGVNINTADQKTLESLPGIGVSNASAYEHFTHPGPKCRGHTL